MNLHVLNLSSHSQREEHEEVHDEDWPVHWDVESLGQGAEDRNGSSPSRR